MSPTDQTPILDLIASMTADSLEVSDLEPDTLMAVRLAALVAIDAPPVSYVLNLEAAAAMGIDADDVRSILAAIAPIVGTARIASATANIVEALAIELEVAMIEEEIEEEQSAS